MRQGCGLWESTTCSALTRVEESRGQASAHVPIPLMHGLVREMWLIKQIFLANFGLVDNNCISYNTTNLNNLVQL